MKRVFLTVFCAVLFVVLASCQKSSSNTTTPTSDNESGTGTGGTGTGSGTTSKSIVSLWTIQNQAWTLNFSNGNTSNTAFSALITMADGVSHCTCNVILNGTSTSGACTLVGNCQFVAGTGTDPGCSTNFGVCGDGGYAVYSNLMTFTNGAEYY